MRPGHTAVGVRAQAQPPQHPRATQPTQGFPGPKEALRPVDNKPAPSPRCPLPTYSASQGQGGEKSRNLCASPGRGRPPPTSAVGFGLLASNQGITHSPGAPTRTHESPASPTSPTPRDVGRRLTGASHGRRGQGRPGTTTSWGQKPPDPRGRPERCWGRPHPPGGPHVCPAENRGPQVLPGAHPVPSGWQRVTQELSRVTFRTTGCLAPAITANDGETRHRAGTPSAEQGGPQAQTAPRHVSVLHLSSLTPAALIQTQPSGTWPRRVGLSVGGTPVSQVPTRQAAPRHRGGKGPSIVMPQPCTTHVGPRRVLGKPRPLHRKPPPAHRRPGMGSMGPPVVPPQGPGSSIPAF